MEGGGREEDRSWRQPGEKLCLRTSLQSYQLCSKTDVSLHSTREDLAECLSDFLVGAL